jgi:hypothetical protein
VAPPRFVPRASVANAGLRPAKTVASEQPQSAAEPTGAATWDDLVDQLDAYGVSYLAGGSLDVRGNSTQLRQKARAPDQLIRDLALTGEPRLGDALIALLLRRPELARSVRVVIAELPLDEPRRNALVARLIAAAALQQIWSFVLPLYLPAQERIPIADLVAEFALSGPEGNDGEALLERAAQLLNGPFPYDWVGAWEDAAEQLLTQLRLAAIPRATGRR